MIECKTQKLKNGDIMDKDFIDIYNKVSNEKYNAETENDLNFNDKIKVIEEYKKYDNWKDYYNLAESYYRHHGNLEIPQNFKTKYGYEYNEQGVELGIWMQNQRMAYKGQGKLKITENQKRLLEKLIMGFGNVNFERWMKNYNLAKAYYIYNGNLEIPQNFKTKNGYEYDEQGVKLGSWISTQRQAYKGQGPCKITEEQKKLLEKIGMVVLDRRDNIWMKKYNLAESYYEHHGNLEIPRNFKTTNGYEYDEEGVKLGSWISTQRQAYKGQGACKLTEEQKKLLEKIGMVPDVYIDNWQKKYNLAESYYKHHGNLEIPDKFKTTNGYEYDEEGVKLGKWISNQRQAYKGQGTCKLTEEQIKLLEKIEIKWFNSNIDKKLQNEIINEQNKKKKQIEILNRVRSYLNTLDENRVYSKEEINLGFVKKLKINKEFIDMYNKLSNEKYNAETKNDLNFNIEIKNIEEIKKDETNFEKWMKNYNLAESYYKHHGNLEIPVKFKTTNGYEYDEQGVKLGKWIDNQRTAYKGQGTYKITEEQIKLLEQIKMKWFENNTDPKLQSEIINEQNKKKKKIEILNRVKSYLNTLDENRVYSKEEINLGFVKKLSK